MATHSSILAWEIPCTEESGGLQSMRSKRAVHDWGTEHVHRHTANNALKIHRAFPQQLSIKHLLFTSDVLDNGKWQYTKHHLPRLTFSPLTYSISNKDAFSLNEPLHHSQIWPHHSRLWNAQFGKEQKAPFCSLKQSEVSGEKLTPRTLHRTRHDLPRQPPHWWRHPPYSVGSPSTSPAWGCLFSPKFWLSLFPH